MDYDQELSTPDRAWELLNKYSVEACSQADGFNPKSAQKHTYTTNSQFKNLAHTLLESADKVACIHLEKAKSGQVRAGGTGTGGTLCLHASLLKDRPTWVPAYFLPWDDKGGAVEITIPDTPSGTDDKSHPRLFFTTCLSGCSVIFKGSSRKPTIFHCGINGDMPSGADANTYWKDFVDYIDTQRALGGARYGHRVKAQATKSQYVMGIVDPKSPPYATQYTTQNALDMSARLERHYKTAYPASPVEILDVMPWGAVFGLRRGDDWQFYLQENVNILYVRRVVDPITKEEVPQTRNVARPMVVTPIFPAGGGVAGLKHNWRSLLLTKAGDADVAPTAKLTGVLPPVDM